MTQRILSTSFWVGCLTILSVGCAAPRNDDAYRPPGAIGRAMPMSQPSRQMPYGPAMGQMPMGQMPMGQMPMGQMPDPRAAAMQTGYPSATHFAQNHPVPDAQALAHAVAQVGFAQPGQAGAPVACGCGNHGPALTTPQRVVCGCNQFGGCQRCNPSPYGYAMPCATGCNSYGTDPHEFICDGGDNPPNAMVRRDDSIAGLQPEDTIVHYTTEAGDIEIKASNKVCLYAPRFLSVRKITGALAGGRAIGAAQFDKPVGATGIDQPLPGLVMSDTTELAHADVARRIDAMRERIRGVPVESVLQLEQATDVMAALVGLTIAELNELRDDEKAVLEQFAQAAITWALDESLEVVIEDLEAPTLTRDESLQGLTIYEFPDAGRLQICKLADRTDALPGEFVHFAIRVENVGDSAVDHVVLTDNLTTRLEYVDGSQTCSGGAEFESFANNGQSLRLQWKLTDKLRVGESVTIRFKCKVR